MSPLKLNALLHNMCVSILCCHILWRQLHNVLAMYYKLLVSSHFCVFIPGRVDRHSDRMTVKTAGPISSTRSHPNTPHPAQPKVTVHTVIARPRMLNRHHRSITLPICSVRASAIASGPIYAAVVLACSFFRAYVCVCMLRMLLLLVHWPCTKLCCIHLYIIRTVNTYAIG